MQAWLSEVRTALESFATTRTRAGVTLALLLALVIVSRWVVPWAVRQVAEAVHRAVFDRERVPISAAQVGWLAPREAVVRTIQFVLVVLLGVSLLLVWGYVEVGVAALGFIVSLLPTIGRVLLTIALVAGVVVATNLLEARLSGYAEGSNRINEHQRGIVFRVVQVVLLLAVGLAVLTVWGVNPSGLLVGAGFLGIVVGMAARQTLGSLIAGFVLMFSRPFELGDWVVIGDYEGVVTDITIVNTRLRNFDGETVVIPNDEASNSTVINRTDRDRLRLRVTVGVDYTTDVEHAEEVATEVMTGLETVRRVPAPQVVPMEFGDSAVSLELRFWIDNPSARRRWRTHGAVVRSVKAAFEREGIKIPYPQRELSGRAETGGFNVAQAQNLARPESAERPPGEQPGKGEIPEGSGGRGGAEVTEPRARNDGERAGVGGDDGGAQDGDSGDTETAERHRPD